MRCLEPGGENADLSFLDLLSQGILTNKKQNGAAFFRLFSNLFIPSRVDKLYPQPYPHWTKYLKHIFPEMKLRGLVPTFSIHVSGSDLYIPMIGLIWNLYFLLGFNRRRVEKGRELPPSSGWRQFPALPSAPVVEARVHINDQHTSLQLGKIRIINGNNLFILSISYLVWEWVEFQIRHLYVLDSHRSFICSACMYMLKGKSSDLWTELYSLRRQLS